MDRSRFEDYGQYDYPRDWRELRAGTVNVWTGGPKGWTAEVSVEFTLGRVWVDEDMGLVHPRWRRECLSAVHGSRSGKVEDGGRY